MMVITSGNGLGLYNDVFGARSNAAIGRPGQTDQVYANGAWGNLIACATPRQCVKGTSDCRSAADPASLSSQR